MYVGRFIVIGPDFGAYRVSSRSFPNRQVVERDGTLTVAPTPDAPETDNPYISYNCVREGGDSVVVGNGSHVDPIAEKLDLGYPARDALAESLLAMDYEKDDYDTPRIAGVVGEDSYIGIVRRDALLVRPVTENPMLVATYEEDDPAVVVFDGDGSPAELAERAYKMDYEHAVCAAGVTYDDGDVDVGFHNGE
ncbi:IMP cyclohydrolase [Halogeometricum borinquense]|uniref:IMP cyclohydrolase n=1 Tax=Halogeometricum borinquense TaxID=60847 RepID=A0A6C0UQY9_9EURY|nr:IMP cyclohydrolase [Halogeometricum borinquense]QIB76309.1 IMP cyclohydrolase [Halogeometricum borinquense]QIQ75255.1 IMP cyclohydrolase [Halogeometricum borinquense]